MNKDNIRFYTGIDNESIKAKTLLDKANIPYIELLINSSDKTPYLEYGMWTFSLIKGIKEFIERWRTNKLPKI